MDQRELVEQARKGDHEAFGQLVRAGIGRLDSTARLIVRDRDLARDAVQDALIRAWRDLPGLRDTDRFDAWVYRLTVNACLDQLRRRRRRAIELEISPLMLSPAGDPAGEVADRSLVDEVLRKLDARGRAIVVLHYFVGLPLSEVADVLEMPLGTVKSSLHRSLSEMRIEVSTSTSGQLAAEGKIL